MSDVVGEAYVLLRPKADARFQADTNRILGNLSLGGIAKGAGAATAGVLGVTSAVSGLRSAISAIVMGGAAFETEINTFGAVTGAVTSQMEMARQTAKALGQDIKLPGVSASDAAVAMTELAKGGLDVTDSLAGVRGALELGTAANTDFGTSAQIIARNLSAFELAGDQASRVADLLAGASIAATGEVTDMAIALSQSAAVAHSAGLSVDETVTAIAQLAKAGLVGSDAGTSLRTMILRLIPSTKKAAEQMAALGVKVLDARGDMLPFPRIIENYRRALDGMSQSQRQAALNTIFGQDAIRAATILARAGAEGLAETARVTTKLGQANVLTTARTKGLAGSLGALRSNLETIAISISEHVNPSIQQFVDFINEGLSALPATVGSIRSAFEVGGLTAGIDKIKATFVGMEPAAKAATVAASGLAVAVGAVAAASFPITATVLAVAGLTAAFVVAYQRSETFRGAVDRIREAAMAAAPVWAQLRQTVTTAIDGIRDTVEQASRYITAVWAVVGNRVTIITRDVFGDVLERVRTVLRIIEGLVDTFVGAFTLDWERAWGGLKTIARAGLDGVVGTVRVWGGSILGVFQGVWKSIEEEALRGVAAVLKVIAKIPTQFSIFGQDVGFRNPAEAALESVQGALAGIRDSRAAKELAEAVSRNTADALAAKNRDVTAAVETTTKRTLQAVADKVKPDARRTGAAVGEEVADGMTAAISTGGQNAIRAIQERLRDAVAETSRQVQAAVVEAQRNLATIGQGLAGQIAAVIDKGPLGQAIKRLQDQLASRQARSQSRQLRQAIVDAQKQIAEARAAIVTDGPLSAGQQAEIDLFLKPKQDALRDARRAMRDFTDQTVLTGLQARQAAEKEAVERQVATLSDQFNRGLITDDQFAKGIGRVLESQTAAVRVAGRTLGIAFARDFNDQVSGLLLQAQAIQQGRDRGLPGLAGAGGRPDIVEPIAVLGQQLSVQREIRDELRRTRAQQQAAADKRARDDAKKKEKKGGGIDLAGITVGVTD